MRAAQDGDVLTRASSATGSNPLKKVLAACLAVLVIDQATKRWAVSALADGPTESVAGVRFALHFNPGASFSLFTEAGPLIGVLAIAISAFLIWSGVNAPGRIMPAIYGGIAGGALGNFADRLTRAEDGILSGAVVDFIDLGWWPVFNIADMALVGGVGVLLVLTLLMGEELGDERPSAAELAASDPESS